MSRQISGGRKLRIIEHRRLQDRIRHMLFVPWLFVSLLLTAAFLKMLENVLPDLEIDGWLPAFMVAAVLPFVGFVLGFATGPLQPLIVRGPWIAWGFSIVMSTLALALAFAGVPGIKAGGVATVAASIALAIFHAAVGFGLDAARQLAAAGAQ